MTLMTRTFGLRLLDICRLDFEQFRNRFRIRDFPMSCVSGLEISSSQGLKKHPKISPREASLFIQILRFFNLRDKEISMPNNNSYLENLFLFVSIYSHPALFSQIFYTNLISSNVLLLASAFAYSFY